MKLCLNCGKKFEFIEFRRTKFCNRKCCDEFLRKVALEKYYKNPQKCLYCGKPTKWAQGKYYKHCSLRCSSLDPITHAKVLATNQKLFGTLLCL